MIKDTKMEKGMEKGKKEERREKKWGKIMIVEGEGDRGRENMSGGTWEGRKREGGNEKEDRK